MLKIKRLGIDTCHETVAFLSRRCPFYRAEEFVALARIEIAGKGRRIVATLNIVDDFTRECVAIEVDRSLPGLRVTRVLDRLHGMVGLPKTIVVDNGPEFAGRTLDAWAYTRGVELRFIRPGKPIENAYVESFNGKFRDECLNEHWFISLADAKAAIEAWRVDYNTVRPPSSLAGRTPDQFAALSGGARGPRPARTNMGLKPEVNRTGLVGGPIQREDGTHGTTQQVFPGVA